VGEAGHFQTHERETMDDRKQRWDRYMDVRSVYVGAGEISNEGILRVFDTIDAMKKENDALVAAMPYLSRIDRGAPSGPPVGAEQPPPRGNVCVACRAEAKPDGGLSPKPEWWDAKVWPWPEFPTYHEIEHTDDCVIARVDKLFPDIMGPTATRTVEVKT
jgi:hypothetical protein